MPRVSPCVSPARPAVLIGQALGTWGLWTKWTRWTEWTLWPKFLPKSGALRRPKPGIVNRAIGDARAARPSNERCRPCRLPAS